MHRFLGQRLQDAGARQAIGSQPQQHSMRGPPGEHAMRRDFFSTQEGLACNRDIRRRLGQTLRETYGSTVTQSLPESFADLLQRLDERERGRSSGPRPERSSPG
jgi:anti-sigma factor NepR-like protein